MALYSLSTCGNRASKLCGAGGGACGTGELRQLQVWMRARALPMMSLSTSITLIEHLGWNAAESATDELNRQRPNLTDLHPGPPTASVPTSSSVAFLLP